MSRKWKFWSVALIVATILFYIIVVLVPTQPITNTHHTLHVARK